MINWTVGRRSAKLTVPPSSDAVVCHSDRQALTTARFRRAGHLATADTCLYRKLHRESKKQDTKLLAITY